MDKAPSYRRALAPFSKGQPFTRSDSVRARPIAWIAAARCL
ncbi:hypothetical protein [Lysobacter gummosus]